MMEYSPEDYEFAIRILYHREELEDALVEEWMNVSGHVALLDELANARSQLSPLPMENMETEKRRLQRRLTQRRTLRRHMIAASIAAAVLLAFGVFFIYRSVLPGDITEWTGQDGIVPGSARAQLILNSGDVINLSGLSRKIRLSEKRAIVHDSEEGLTYIYNDPVQGENELEYNRLRVPTGGFYKLKLSDGTKVWLNSETELTFPAHFLSNERKVYLKGEAYFEVVKDQDKPFRVFVNGGDVKVLGTAFNVSAYENESMVYTTLVEGSVLFHVGMSGAEVMLKPGMQSVLDIQTGVTQESEVDTECFTGWVNGRFVFRFMTLETIIRQLERWYDFKVNYVDEEIRNEEFQGVIERDSKIENVFRAIEMVTNVKFTIEGRQVTVERRKQ